VLLYEYMARTYSLADWTTMNYGYATLPGEDGRTVVDPAIPSAVSAALHAHCDRRARGGAWGGSDVLEIGSGRGGGAAYLAHRLAPQRLSASKFPPPRQLSLDAHVPPPLEYRQGDPKALPSVRDFLTSF